MVREAREAGPANLGNNSLLFPLNYRLLVIGTQNINCSMFMVIIGNVSLAKHPRLLGYVNVA